MKSAKQLQNKRASLGFFDSGQDVRRPQARMTISQLIMFLFVLFLPMQLGKHFFLPFSYISGLRVDYLAPTVYLTDLLVILLALMNWSAVVKLFRTRFVLITVFALLVHSLLFASVVEVALYRLLKIVEGFFVFFLLKEKGPSQKLILSALGIGAVIETALVVLQFIYKHSLQGVFYFLGERAISLSLPDIAKASLNGVEFLRPYGTFSHPNSMAGFYLLLYTFVLTSKKTTNHIVWKNVFLFFASALIFLSFSKVAIALFLLVNLMYLFQKGDFSCKLCVFSRALTLAVLALVFGTAQTDPYSFVKRLDLFQSAVEVIKTHLLFGVGLGNYLIAQGGIPTSYLVFTPQPVHNIFLLLASELGLVLVGVFLFLGFKEVLKRIRNFSFVLCLLVVFTTGMVDHYWITLQQNFLLLPVVFGLMEA